MMNFQPMFIREEIVKTIRSFFYAQKFHEIITPTLNTAIPLEPNLYPFTTTWNTLKETKTLFLSQSPERSIKLLLGQGIGNSFSIGHSFRNLENSGTLHIPEFLMLEWYRENADYKVIMKDVQSLILELKTKVDIFLKRNPSSILKYQNNKIDLSKPWNIYSLSDLFFEYAHINYEEMLAKENTIFKIAKQKGYQIKQSSWQELFDQLFVNEIEPKLPIDKPFFLIDFPSKISLLCKPQNKNPLLAERFEFYIAGMELGNGNTENTDTQSIKKVFIAEEKKRQLQNIITSPIDNEFLHALDNMKSKTYAGIGVGIDRLTMLLSNSANISDLQM
ncbi:MAG: amino acid--tRNA ligase-related protein [bacterium]|nr:amino acid--tRNA ligase-related protein [bacterium]